MKPSTVAPAMMVNCMMLAKPKLPVRMYHMVP